MPTNCFSCKWYKLKGNKQALAYNRLSPSDIETKCAECVEEFRRDPHRMKRVCLGCSWKDRNLPYEARKLHCKVCVEAFASESNHDCSACVWNNPKRRQPTDASLAHCYACLKIAKTNNNPAGGKTGGSDIDGGKNCEKCSYHKLPEQLRRQVCLSCSIRFAESSKVRNSTNELSNKGQTIISYDNHNSDMTDDRDTVAQIATDYKHYMRSDSGSGTKHPVFQFVDSLGMTVDQFAVEAYEKMKRFLYEFAQLTDMQALLFLSEVKGEKKTVFAKNHNITHSMVNSLSKQLLARSPVFWNFIMLSRGTVEGTRGRKSKSGNPMDKVPKKTKKIVYAGVFQPTMGF